MKTRYRLRAGVGSVETVNTATGASTVSASFQYLGYDQLVVIFDHVARPADRATIHGHEFRKAQGIQWSGMHIQESASPPLRTVWRGPANYQGDVEGQMVLPSPDWSGGYNSALSEMLEKLRSNECGSGLDLSVDLAERRQVAKMLKETAKAVKFVKSFHPKNWASKWLEYQYGWKPLAGSVFGTVDAVMHRRTSQYAVFSGKARDTFRSQVEAPFAYGGSIRMRRTQDHRFRTKIVCEYAPSNTALQQIAGYTSLNPLSIGWELTPFSFVVDWFCDIGGYLHSLETALLYAQDFKRGW